MNGIDMTDSSKPNRVTVSGAAATTAPCSSGGGWIIVRPTGLPGNGRMIE